MRRGSEIFYFAGEQECDFILKDKKKITGAIQVCYEFTKENRDRETGGLLKAMAEFKLTQGMILTYDQENTLISEGKTIIIRPVWKWLLDNFTLPALR